MAFITATEERTFTIEKWGGLNESPDGDVNLKAGEASIMQNWRITADGNLKVRPGRAAVAELSAGDPVRALFSGYIDNDEKLIGVCDGSVYDMTDLADVTEIGTLTDGETTVFGFGGNLYFLNGNEYKQWDGTTFADVTGYIPLITIATPPTGGGTSYEVDNLLIGSVRQQFSPDATTSTVFYLRDTDVDSVDWVKEGGVTIDPASYTVSEANGTVTYTPAATGTNTIEIQYTKEITGNRDTILAQKYAEIFGGINDARICVYGDGTHKLYYSGVDDNGTFRADYFPATNEMQIGSANTPINSVAKQYDRLLILKTDSAWYSENYGYLTSNDGTIVTKVTVLPLNDAIGSEAHGRAPLIENNPVSLCKGAAYEWRSTQIRDERMAKRISDKAQATISGFDLSACLQFENNRDKEHWIVHGSTVLVHNYQNDTWYVYTNMPVTAYAEHAGKVYIGLTDGSVYEYSDTYRSDAGVAIDAQWRGGAFSFGADYRKKYINRIFATLKPDSHASATVSVLTNNQTSEPQDNTVEYNLATFEDADFADWSFSTSYRPQTKRIKIKLKNFSFFTPLIESNSATETATMLNMSIPVQFGGEVKTR